MPQYGFPGLRPGDQWCVCAARWAEALEAGAACPVVLAGTHLSALEFVDLDDLRAHAVAELPPISPCRAHEHADVVLVGLVVAGARRSTPRRSCRPGSASARGTASRSELEAVVDRAVAALDQAVRVEHQGLARFDGDAAARGG